MYRSYPQKVLRTQAVSTIVAAAACRELAAWVTGYSASIHPGTSVMRKSTLMRKWTKTSIMK